MPDAPGRVERVLNLLALLLDTRVALTREEIVREVSGYPQQVSANRRAFERDKEVLRGMGVPITTEMIGDAGEIGYRVKPDDYYLPELDLSARRDRGAAGRGERGFPRHQVGEGALLKLGGLGSVAATPIASLPIAPALASLFEAFRARAVVKFVHRGTLRTVEPWGLSSKRGQWYVVGWDHDRERGARVPGRPHRGQRRSRCARRVRCTRRLPAREPHRGPSAGCSVTTSR